MTKSPSPTLQTMLDGGAKTGMARPELDQLGAALHAEGFNDAAKALLQMTANALHYEGSPGILPAANLASLARSLAPSAAAAPAPYVVRPGAPLALERFAFTADAPTIVTALVKQQADSAVVLLKGIAANGETKLFKGIDLSHAAASESLAASGMPHPSATATPLQWNSPAVRPAASAITADFYGVELARSIYHGTLYGWDREEQGKVASWLAVDGMPEHRATFAALRASAPSNGTIASEQVKIFAAKIGRAHSIGERPAAPPITPPAPAPAPAAELEETEQAQTFPQIVNASVIAGASRPDAVMAAIKSNPTEYTAWLQAGGGKLIGQVMQPAKPVSSKAAGAFVALFNELRTNGRSKPESVSLAMAMNPAAHRAWLQNGGGNL